MSEIIIPLVGGLGNQMFQYAAASAVAEKCNVPLKLDLSWFETSTDRNYALYPFNIKAEIIDSNKKSLGLPVGDFAWLSNFFKKYSNNIFHESSFRFDPKINEVGAPATLNGYFQSEKYFRRIKNKIKSDFQLAKEPEQKTLDVLDHIKNSEAICLHVRRGDYISDKKTNSYHGVCSLDYYELGLEKASSGMSSPHCFIFSDDPEWVKNEFRIDIPSTVVDIHSANEAHEDLRLMSACQSFVIANSSLSWWGAWLGQDLNKTVIAPKRWFAEQSIDTSDLIPKDWLRI